MLEKVNALPGAELHLSIDDWDYFARTRQNGAYVRRTIVTTFRGVFEPWSVFGHQSLEELLQIAPGGWIGVFHQNETTTGVPNEDGNRARTHAALVDYRFHLRGKFVGALAVGGDGKVRGVNAHRRR